jgi:uncharacterized protein (TIGR02145 family)
MTPQILNYEIKRVLGEGGMAVVYLANNIKFGTNVALKLLKKEFIHNSNIRARFIAEARNMFRMSHPHIIKVTDLIDDDDTVAFVMEYIEGETLKAYLDRKGKLNEKEIGGLLEQMLSALEYAHDQGLVHRDIKPSNFMVSPLGKLKLMDFGIAKQTNPGSPEYTSTGTNQRMGTAMYMSPEQIHETRSVTSRSDIYSLGVVLWQMVTGQKPYLTETLSAFQLKLKIVNEPLPLTGTNWDNLIQKATEKDSQHRYADINSFRWAWQKGNNDFNARRDGGDKTVIEQQSKQPVSKTPKEPTKPPRKRDLLMLILLLLLIIASGYFIWNGNDSTQKVEVEAAILENENEPIISSVMIGDQEWQTKNLDVGRFRNGDPIPQAISAEEWKAAGEREEPAWCFYDNETENGKIYGKLYNWYAVNDERGLAPEGWHIPNDEEWITLTDYLGGEEVAGGKMKSTGTTYWQSSNEGVNNESAFSALPGGIRNYYGSLSKLGGYAFFWSATEFDNFNARYFLLSSNLSFVVRINGISKSVGASVRCLRD